MSRVLPGWGPASPCTCPCTPLGRCRPPRRDRPISPHDGFDVVLAEDDEDDYHLTREALARAQALGTLHWVRDGEALLHYLRTTCLGGASRLPSLVLLDLNMPRMDGREALGEMKRDPLLRRIPVVVLTTSDAPQDIARAYDLGVNSFVQKPVTFHALTSTIKGIAGYWSHTARPTS